MKRASFFVDAVVFATLTGLALSCVVGCAGVSMETFARSLDRTATRPAETAADVPDFDQPAGER